MQKKKRFGGGSKKGRQSMKNKPKYEKYRAKHTRERNKARAISAHLKKQPNDNQAKKKIEELKTLYGSTISL